MALIHLNFHSDTLGRPAQLEVILPESASTRIGMDGKRETVFPTVYLLHGLSDDHTIWQRRTSIERYASRYGIAVVMPNAERSWYADMVHGDKYFTFISEEVPRVCRSFFSGMSAEREYNYIAGLSMGGYGALKFAFANPERYMGVASFSGAIDVAKYIKEEGYMGRRGWGNIFGEGADIGGTVNDVYSSLAKRIEAGDVLPRIYLSCGTEDPLLPATRRVHEMLDDAKISHAYREAHGEHDWSFWDDEIKRALKFFFE